MCLQLREVNLIHSTLSIKAVLMKIICFFQNYLVSTRWKIVINSIWCSVRRFEVNASNTKFRCSSKGKMFAFDSIYCRTLKTFIRSQSVVVNLSNLYDFRNLIHKFKNLVSLKLSGMPATQQILQIVAESNPNIRELNLRY
jgi:hypothetical protein